MQSGAVSPLAVTILICALRGVGGTVTVSGSGGTGIPNQQALTLRCSYTVTSGDVVTAFTWKRMEGSPPVTIASGSVTAHRAGFFDSWKDKGVFVGNYNSSLDIQLPASHVTASYAGTYRCEVAVLSGTGHAYVTASVLNPPSISGLPLAQTVIEFSNLRIDCSTHTTPGNPPTTSYRWTYGDSTVSTGAVLDRRNISRSQRGDYTCTASNSQGSDSASVSVDVQYPPSISAIPATQNVTEFSNLTIDCSTYTTSGNPPTSYRWTYGASVVSTGAVLDRRNISRSQGGDYTCTASNSQGSASASVNVVVKSPPSISGLPPAQTVTEFSNLTIDCSTYTTPGNPSTTSYRWTYGGSAVSSGAILDRRNISRSQGGDYTCTASNSQGSDSASVSVDVHYGPGTSVTIIPSGSLERVEGSGAFTATCTAVCNPNCNITWRKDNSDLLSGQISISNVSRIDQGNYTCQAQNGIGAPQQKSLTLVVYYLDSPHLTFNKSEVMENATVTVDCDVYSNPTVEMTVTNVDNNTVLVQKNTNSISHTIQRAQCLHNGSFICSADNKKAGSVHQTTKSLSVLCSPRHDFRKQLNSVVAQDKYTTAYLTADIIANPLPNFTWYRQDGGSVSPIRNSTGITVISDGLKSVLQINITSDDDYGEYAVDVQNSVGQKRMVFNLTSKTPPSAPSSLQVYLVGTTSVSLQWVSAFNGGSKQTFTVKYKSQSQSQWTTGKSGIADSGKGKQVQGTVTGLKPLNSYTFQVFGSNIYGEGEMTIIQGTTLEEQEESINMPAMGGGIGASLLVILIIVVVLVILHKRGVLLKSRDENQDAELFEGRSQEEPEIQENCIYETSDNKTVAAEYAVVVKKKAAVQKEDIYAKTERKGKANVSRDMKKARKPARERRNREDVYENTVPGQNFAYGNAGYESREGDHMTECLNGRDKDGLLYVGIDFGNNPPSQIIHRAEESTEYAAIAIGEVGPPTTPDEYEQQNGRHNASAI